LDCSPRLVYTPPDTHAVTMPNGHCGCRCGPPRHSVDAPQPVMCQRVCAKVQALLQQRGARRRTALRLTRVQLQLEGQCVASLRHPNAAEVADEEAARGAHRGEQHAARVEGEWKHRSWAQVRLLHPAVASAMHWHSWVVAPKVPRQCAGARTCTCSVRHAAAVSDKHSESLSQTCRQLHHSAEHVHGCRRPYRTTNSLSRAAGSQNACENMCQSAGQVPGCCLRCCLPTALPRAVPNTELSLESWLGNILRRALLGATSRSTGKTAPCNTTCMRRRARKGANMPQCRATSAGKQKTRS
jgi:hypothetical protein